VLDQPATLQAIVDRIKSHLGLQQVQVARAGGGDPDALTHVGVCAGAGGSLLDTAIAQDCRAFITGEMRHHDVLSAVSRGCSVILAGHTNTERPYLKTLARRLGEATDLDVVVSRRDSDPLVTM
jgi:putative NIF3 family GTP cyclohydrolase 1 type 2